MVRKIHNRLYVMAFIITAAIFMMGILLGVVIESKRLAYVDQRAKEEKINFDSLQLQYLYLSAVPEKAGCNAFAATLNNYIKKTEITRARLQDYATTSGFHKPEFAMLKREYIISQMNYWILAQKTKTLCNTDTVTLLFFYSTPCSKCEDQGFVLDYLKKRFDEKILIFAIDGDFNDEPMIQIIKQTYNVTSVPTVVVEDIVVNGFVGKDDLLQYICPLLRDKPQECV